MAGITLAQAQTQLDAWLAASAAVATGQEYVIGDRRLKRADAGQIQQQIQYWNGQVQQLSARASGYGRTRTIVSA